MARLKGDVLLNKTHKELQEITKERGLPASGSKLILAERILEDEERFRKTIDDERAATKEGIINEMERKLKKAQRIEKNALTELEDFNIEKKKIAAIWMEAQENRVNIEKTLSSLRLIL